MPIRCGHSAPDVRRACARGTRFRILSIVVLLASVVGCGRSGDPENEAHVAAAASLRRVLPPLIKAFESSSPGVPLVVNYASSGTLRRQVEAGAPVAGVLFASGDHVDRLIERGLASQDSRRVFARNSLVLITSDDATRTTFQSLKDIDVRARIAIGDPSYVPAGRYAKQALEGLGQWERLQASLIFAQDVAGVVTYVRRREAALGIAYRTDVRAIASMRTLDVAEGPWAPKPAYVGAAIQHDAHAARFSALLKFLVSDEARAVWTEHGFASP